MAVFSMLVSMLIFGTIGVFVSMLTLPAAVLSLCRAALGAFFLLLVLVIRRIKPDFAAIRKNLLPLLLSGAALGFNWMLLFASYRHTTVAVATLCYYLAPVFVILLSPLVLKERLTAKKLSCAAVALGGAVLISGAAAVSGQDLTGILLALGAAVLYASIVLLNKQIHGLPALETTFIQLAVSALVMTPYVLLTEDCGALSFPPQTILLLLVLGIVHTGIPYLLYFSAIRRLPAQSSALLSYLDPVTAILLSALLLQQPLSLPQAIGAALILGATLLPELLPVLRRHPA